MPCNDRDYVQERREADQQISNMLATLCGIASVLEQQSMLSRVLDNVDWTQAGVPRSEFEDWWADHKARDAEEKRRAAAERHRAQLAQQARAKLTPDELKALSKSL